MEENVTIQQLFVSNIRINNSITYTTDEKPLIYTYLAYVIGALITLSNFIVVISSGLIMKKGQNPKSTYMLLGNMSLADMLFGMYIILGAAVKGTYDSTSIECLIKIGLFMCPLLVSSFSVGLIAVDRYVYILHGLYYQRWVTTKRVRIVIAGTWLIGITFGIMPVTSWSNPEMKLLKCYLISVFPYGFIFIAIFNIVLIIVVAILYSIILKYALRNVNAIINSKNDSKKSSKNDNKTNNDNYFVNYNKESDKITIRKCASDFKLYDNKNSDNKIETSISTNNILNEIPNSVSGGSKNIFEQSESRITINSIASSSTEISVSTSDSDVNKKRTTSITMNRNKKSKAPNKWRIITVVLLTSGSFIVTWLPFFICIICYYILCESKTIKNPNCQDIRILLFGPLKILAYVNSVLNPLIYGWWHKGFRRSLRHYYTRFYCCNKQKT